MSAFSLLANKKTLKETAPLAADFEITKQSEVKAQQKATQRVRTLKVSELSSTVRGLRFMKNKTEDVKRDTELQDDSHWYNPAFSNEAGVTFKKPSVILEDTMPIYFYNSAKPSKSAEENEDEEDKSSESDEENSEEEKQSKKAPTNQAESEKSTTARASALSVIGRQKFGIKEEKKSTTEDENGEQSHNFKGRFMQNANDKKRRSPSTNLPFQRGTKQHRT